MITVIKFVGCVLILTSSAGMGWYFSSELKGRIQDLRDLKRLIFLLRGDIRYANTPLPEAVQALSVRHDGKYKKFLANIADRLNELGGISFCTIWKEAVGKELGNTSLSKKDLNNLAQFGENLGYLDKDMQINTIDLYISQLEDEIKDISKNVKEKSYLYNSLGILGGIFITIIML
ncbi:stage III sporulation protein SpoAB [Anaerocolumna cellulosilytica]|uniref:Stage III sporulation protein SpoAB n=1 Tax=Anaerocolumna cellulosilytica TaxID=433286 RepID=A0A6S6RA40_9FIRM|nr:stage III sporulation protein AB [Anaerocolumna cellulosilytica]MBB5196621.1 stage III sporulation protein AB [Anaerocolumna cellulosilytica]BCJ95721.1 stage III sporulation protein SpoAB [Anaerocolumna cellulosilytica]